MSKVGHRQSTGSDCHSLKRDMSEIIDKMTGELDRRFLGNEPFLKACCIECIIFAIWWNATNCYGVCLIGIDVEKLKAQVSVASNMFRMSDHVSDAHGVLSELLKMEAAFPDLLLFVQIVLTVPIASATAERSLLTMKRVKTYLRSIKGSITCVC